MNNIQIDMFEVQLGAALLLQFQAGEDNWISVLADAGVKASGYSLDHVHSKLPGALRSGDNLRLDLIIGTHYDEDHLEGLVPIIEDTEIEIGEVWLPPVANDTEAHAVDDSVQDRHLLAHQFAQEDGEGKLRGYLQAKQAVCEELRALESAADEYRSPDRRRRQPQEDARALEADGDARFDMTYFRRQIQESNATLGLEEGEQDDREIADAFVSDSDETLDRYFSMPYWRYWREDFLGTQTERRESFKHLWRQDSSVAEAHAQSFAGIRRAAAKDAINATSLSKVVSALKGRGMKPICRIIADGVPQRFVWRENGRRFVPGQQIQTEGPEFQLLGPSEGLVKKHWDRLPIGRYAARVALQALSIRQITPSNQLSYVARFKFSDQGILVCGDAGCVDFKPPRGEYFQALLAPLLPLHVIQIAHHGGNNAHFYRVLSKAAYAAQEEPSLLLLSHATDDKTRPSKEFSMFIAEVRKDGDDMQLLFTSRPTSDKVRDYAEIVHPVVGDEGDVGDVRIEYNGTAWEVLSHAVKVGA